MKENLTEYLKIYGQKTFREYPFCPVDALAFAQLAYLKLDGVVPGFGAQDFMSWEELRNHANAEHMFSDPVYGPGYREIFDCMSKSRRYRNVRVNYFQELVDKKQEIQFAAVTFLLGDTSIYVAFRGTDETLIAWKEDLKMSYMRRVPSQSRALAYLKGVARYTAGRLILGGHSKGGNLAVYAASCAPEQVQRRIRRVYSFDGPGFSGHFYEKSDFQRIQRKYYKIVPERSLIGVGFAKEKNYHVVRSYGKGLMQHDLMNWKIKDGAFVYRKKLRHSSFKKAENLNQLIDSMSKEQIAEFIGTIYELLTSTSAEDVYELAKKPMQKVRLIYTEFHKLEKIKRKEILRTVRKLMRSL